MKIIVTGAAGFIGSHLFDYLLDKGYKVLGIDNYSTGSYKHPSIKKLDLLTDSKKLIELISTFKPKIIYHLAAWPYDELSYFVPAECIRNNLGAYLNLLTLAIKSNVKRIVLVSSTSVYGAQEPPFSEKMARKPHNIYAIAKAAMEETTEVMSRIYDFEYVILRPHNIYGPRQSLNDPYRNVVAIFINCLLKKKPFYIYGNGNQKRSFTFIEDIIPYLAKVGWVNVDGEIINLGPEQTHTINELAQGLLKHFPDALKPVHLSKRLQEVEDVYATNAKSRKLLGYKTYTSFKKGIKKTVEWAKIVGPLKSVYLKEYELDLQQLPKTWKEKLI